MLACSRVHPNLQVNPMRHERPQASSRHGNRFRSPRVHARAKRSHRIPQRHPVCSGPHAAQRYFFNCGTRGRRPRVGMESDFKARASMRGQSVLIGFLNDILSAVGLTPLKGTSSMPPLCPASPTAHQYHAGRSVRKPPSVCKSDDADPAS